MLLGICICCSPVTICCLWRTGSSTRKLIHYRCCIWATSPCLAARHSDKRSLSGCGRSPPLSLKDLQVHVFGSYCVEGLFRSTAVPPGLLGFYCQSRGDQDTLSRLCLLIYMSLVFFFFFPPTVSDKLPIRHRRLMWLIHWLHGSDISGICSNSTAQQTNQQQSCVAVNEQTQEMHIFPVKKEEDFTWLIGFFCCFVFWGFFFYCFHCLITTAGQTALRPKHPPPIPISLPPSSDPDLGQWEAAAGWCDLWNLSRSSS